MLRTCPSVPFFIAVSCILGRPGTRNTPTQTPDVSIHGHKFLEAEQEEDLPAPPISVATVVEIAKSAGTVVQLCWLSSRHAGRSCSIVILQAGCLGSTAARQSG